MPLHAMAAIDGRRRRMVAGMTARSRMASVGHRRAADNVAYLANIFATADAWPSSDAATKTRAISALFLLAAKTTRRPRQVRRSSGRNAHDDATL